MLTCGQHNREESSLECHLSHTLNLIYLTPKSNFPYDGYGHVFESATISIASECALTSSISGMITSLQKSASSTTSVMSLPLTSSASSFLTALYMASR